MPSKNEIEQQLKSIDNWVLVSHKKNIVQGLSKLLRKNETVIDCIDGLYSGIKISKPGSDVSGVLCVTSQRVLFITGEKSKIQYEELPFRDIEKISYEKGTSTVFLKILLKSNSILFKSFANVSLVKNFIVTVSEMTDSNSPPYEENTQKVLNEINTAFASIMEWNNKLSKELSYEIADVRGEDLLNLDKDNLNFLFKEAKKIVLSLNDYTEKGEGPNIQESLIDDLIIISSLCAYAEGHLTDEERIFMSMVIMPIKETKESSFLNVAKDLFDHTSYPEKYSEDLVKYVRSINSYMKKPDSSLNLEGSSLKTMNQLRSFDKEHGTNHADRVGSLLYTYCQCLAKADSTITEKEEDRLKELHLLIFQRDTMAADTIAIEEPEEEETLEEVMEKINKLVGMKNIKDEIQTFINLIKVTKEREERGLPITPLSLHAVFYGPPGTGKTTIARLLGKVYRCLGLIKKGHLIETDRAGLVAGYVGQTAINVDKVIQKALDGVLFIDEAYSLVPEHGGKDFGQEAVDTILKRMEDHRDRLVVIVAGYTDEMQHFINSNPGLKSRFSRYFYFDHFSPEELIQIFDIFSQNVEFKVEDTAREKLLTLLQTLHERRDKAFGNGRLVRNVFEKIVERQANRIASITPLTDEILCSITLEDIPEEKDLRHSRDSKMQ